jgi:cyclopropane fatty-acyl-phospholipid synthase-like methyltransferase
MVREGRHHSAQMKRLDHHRLCPSARWALAEATLFFVRHISYFPETSTFTAMKTKTLTNEWKGDVNVAPSNIAPTGAAHTNAPTDSKAAFDAKVTAHFHASAELYKLWSPEGHLHFGYWDRTLNPFRRKPMLEALVHRVVRELEPIANKRFADLGCGYGAAARLVARTYGTRVDAITVVEEQMQEGTIASLMDGTYDQVTMELRDFRHTGLPDASLDGAYAMESICYGTGADKADVLKEVARILKPGARFAMVDGFLMKEPNGFRKKIVDTVATGWAVLSFPRLTAFTAELRAQGFTDVQVTDMSWRMGPCALHGLPLLALTLAKQLFSGERMPPLEKAHLLSCGLGILLGTQHDLFRYCMVTATKA